MKIARETYYKLLTGAFHPGGRSDKVPDFAYNPLNKTGEIYTPVIDKAWLETNAPPVWPKGKKFAVCLTHDVDAVSELNFRQNMRSISKLASTASSRALGESLRWTMIHSLNTLKGLTGQKDQLCHFGKWLNLEREYGARSTFFFAPERVGKPHASDCVYKYDQYIEVNEKRIQVSHLMKKMDQEGWEIGLHPSWHAHADLEEMKSQKKQIEDCLGHSIESVRQHFLKYDPLITHPIQSEAGFKYDSTLGFNDNVGFRRGSSYPFECYDLTRSTKLPLLQIPLIVQDGALLTSEKGLRLGRGMALEYIELMLEAVKEVGGVLTLSWHPHTMNRSGFWKLYQETLELLARENPWFGTVSEVGQWWTDQVKIDLHKFTGELAGE